MSAAVPGVMGIRHSIAPSPAAASKDCVLPGESGEVEKFHEPSENRKLTIAVLILFCNLIPMVSFGIGIGGGFYIADSLGVQGPGNSSWIAASYPLTQGAFVLIAGRLGIIFGHKNVLLAGSAWWVLWTFVNGFCSNFVAFTVARSFSGIGGGLVVPNAVAVIGTTFPPGRMRNLSLGLFGAGAPVGGALGCLFAGLFIEYASWKWLFIFLALLGLFVFGCLGLVLPSEATNIRSRKMDWIGSFLGIGGMILFNFVWNQAPAVGWSNPYEIALLVLAIVVFAAFGLWEHKYAQEPIMPVHIWRAPSFFPLVIGVLFSFMSFGSFIWYFVSWHQILRHWSVLSIAGCVAPMAVAQLAVQWILAIGAVAVLLPSILVVTMPEQQTYWAQAFPAIVIVSLCPDFIFTAAQIIASNSVRRHEQGIAGSVIGTIQLYGTAIGLGFAGTVEVNTNLGGKSTIQGFRGALYFGIGMAVASLVIDLLFVRMAKDEREGWHEDDVEHEAKTAERWGASAA